MKKRNSLIAAQTFVIFCAIILPSLPLYCRQATEQLPTKKTIPTPSAAETKEEDIKEEKTATKQMSAVTTPPSTWIMIYNLLPQIFVQSLSKGSDVGVGAFTKAFTKGLILKYTFSDMKSTALSDLDKLIQTLPEEKKLQINEEDKLGFVSNYFKANKLDFNQMEQQSSTSFIVGSAASTALIYTFSAMMGSLLKIGIGIGLQLLAPQAR
jgi:hypothetical protein